MGLTLSHNDALRLAGRSGGLVRCLYGPPQVVIGIERGGTAIAQTFAERAGALACVLVTRQRASSNGWRGKARQGVQAVVPRFVRRLYKRLFFRSIVRFLHRRQRAQEEYDLSDQDLARLRAVIDPGTAGAIVVVDDAIDSGGTLRHVLSALRDLAPKHRTLVFALTATAGIRVNPQQLNAFANLVDYVEGDLGGLAAAYREKAQWSRPADWSDHEAAQTPRGRRLYLDLDGTIVPDSFASAFATLMRVQFGAGAFASLSRSIYARLARKARIKTHRALSKHLDAGIRALTPAQNRRFQDELAAALQKDCRWSLLAIAQATHVQSRIVTAALSSYAPAVETAFGLAVLTGSGENPAGEWVEVDSQAKVNAIHSDLPEAAHGNGHEPVLFVGDTLIDAMATAEGITTSIVPHWDETGLLTILGAETWWALEGNPSNVLERSW